MHLDPALPPVVAGLFAVIAAVVVLKLFRQPSIIAFLLAGVVIGPHGLGRVSDAEVVHKLESFGVLFLLFFVGMEVVPERLKARWRVPVIGSLLQVVLSAVPIALVGAAFGWSPARIMLLTFVVSLSSSAIVIRVLQDQKTLATDFGQDMLGVLLVQDLLVIPMLIALGLFTGEGLEARVVVRQVVGGLATAGILAWILSDRGLPWIKLPLRLPDTEIQVFGGLILCLGLALFTAGMGLSSALGAFVAGALVTRLGVREDLHHKLEPFQIVFVALFFISIGMSLDIGFVRGHLPQVAALVTAAYVIGTVANALILNWLGYSRKESLYGGCVLAQIGEFSFVLAAVGYKAGMITEVGYQLALSVISLSLLLGPLWIGVGRRLTKS